MQRIRDERHVGFFRSGNCLEDLISGEHSLRFATEPDYVKTNTRSRRQPQVLELSMPFHHQMRVRYCECDQQGVVFNAHYVAYMDDATEVWLSSFAPDGDEAKLGWDWMVARVSVNWESSARHGDTLEIDVGIVHWGTTSFHFGFIGRVGERVVFRGRSVCVSVERHTLKKTTVPDHVRGLMGDAVDWDVPE